MRDLCRCLRCWPAPSGMGLMMLFMGKGMFGSKEKLQTSTTRSLADLEGEQARLGEEITRLERDDRESRQPAGITGS